jgi:hypothetical protein
MSPVRVLQQQIPLARSILWAPTSAARPADVAFPVFLRQSALQAIYEHLATLPPPGQGILGFMLGDRCECPVTGVSYSVIDAALRLNQTIYGDRTRDVVTRLWKRLEAQLEAQRAQLVGWYHTHAPLPLELSPHDVETHEEYFGEPWQVGMLVGTDTAAPAGAFFRGGSDPSWVRTPQPFYELLNEDSIRPDGKKRSFVTWKTYRAYNPPAMQPRAATSAPVPPPPPRQVQVQEPEEQPELDGLEHMPQAELEEPGRVELDDLSRAAPLEEPVAPAEPKMEEKWEDPNELKFLTSADDFAAGSLPPPPRPLAPPPPAQRPREPAPVDSDPLNWGEEPPFEQEEVQEPLPERVAPPPPPLEPRAARRRRRSGSARRWVRRIIAIGLIAFVIAAGWMAYQRFGPSLRQRLNAFMASRHTPAKVTPPRKAASPPKVMPPPAAASPPPPRPARRPPPSSPEFALLDQAGDSLARALQAYNGRMRLFEKRLLDCPSLGRGVARVERAVARYGMQRNATRAALDPDRAAWDRELRAGVDSAGRLFQRSRCEHP